VLSLPQRARDALGNPRHFEPEVDGDQRDNPRIKILTIAEWRDCLAPL